MALYIFDHIDTSSGCWLWTRSVNGDGYVYVTVDGKQKRGHIVAYEEIYGPVPDGMVLDHICHDPAVCPGGKKDPHRRCVNPNHLRPVPAGQNNRRDRVRWAASQRTHCPAGHEYTEENTLWEVTSAKYPNPVRRCKACRIAQGKHKPTHRKANRP